ncbi:MAG TPA: NAD(P)H-hydrate dehydratase, partial [Burkholderiaceae bacterium]|nr:NAD(P)H-hydrate dehydratase [Burkholderiaceae bacterium]
IETLGVELPPTPVWRTDPADFASVCQPRRRDTHKGTYGTLGVLGGNVGMVGAALLAARAALRLGAGRVHVECLGAQELRLDPQQPELMFRTLATVPVLDAVVVGCGLGADRAAHEALASALARPTALVLDADALNLVAGAATLAAGLRERRAATVLTPHPLEAARLLGIDAADVQRDRVQAARELAARTGALAMLKGAGTVVAHSDGRAWINPTGGPALATPGSGDVLAGMIGALLAQRFDPVEATLAAVWLHGAAADRYGGDVGLTAAEIAPLAVRRLVELRQAASA